MNARPIRVLLADDQSLIRDALSALLTLETGLHVIGQAKNGIEAIEAAKRLKPDVVLMDVRMPGMSGPEATSRLKNTRGLAKIRVLVLTTFEDSEVVRACMGAGADGFIGKGTSTAGLIEAIHAVHRGELPLSPRAARTMLSEMNAPSDADPGSDTAVGGLTSREIDVVKLVGLGLSNEEIGRRLSISPATAKTHVRNAMRKLSTRDRAQLVALVHRIGLRE